MKKLIKMLSLFIFWPFILSCNESNNNLNSNSSSSDFSSERFLTEESSINSFSLLSESNNIESISSLSNKDGDSFLSESFLENELPNTYSIEYVLNGGENNIDNPSTRVEGESLFLKPASYNSFVFDGWYLDDDFTKEVNVIDDNFSNDLIVYAKWIPDINDFNYYQNENIKDLRFYSGTNRILYLPEETETFALTGLFSNENVETIIIPKAVISIIKSNIGEDLVACYPNLKAIFVDSENDYFLSIDGVLYSKDLKTIVFYPSNRDGIQYTINEQTENIDSACFVNCNKLNEIKFENNVTTLKSSCIAKCANLSKISLGPKIDRLITSAFFECYNISTIFIDEKNPKYYSPNNLSCILEKDTKSLVMAFNSPLIPNEALSIKRNAFVTSNVETIIIPASLVSISDSAFANAPYLKKVIIEDGITSIGNSCFNLCDNLEEIIIPNSVVSIGRSAFKSCTNLKSISLPLNLKRIESETFYCCNSLRNVSFNENLEFIGSYAFFECYSLIIVNLPKNLTTLSNMAFCECQNLVRVTIDENLTTIPYGAFMNCFKLFEIINKSSIEIVPSDLEDTSYTNYKGFESYLKKIISSEEESSINVKNNFVLYKDGDNTILITYLGDTEIVKIPDEVNEISRFCFNRDYKANSIKDITKIIFGNNVNKICLNAICACSKLETIILNDTLKELNNGFYYGCPNLKNIVLPTNLETFEENCFINMNRTIRLFLRVGESESYSLIEKINNISYSNIEIYFYSDTNIHKEDKLYWHFNNEEIEIWNY